jgi:uncharacterized repeat protein (TIGR03803 family)
MGIRQAIAKRFSFGRSVLVRLRCGCVLVLSCAIVFCTPSQAQTFVDIYNFTTNNSSQLPHAPLTQGRNGALYGTTHGQGNYGSIVKVTTAGLLAQLFSFDYTDGSNTLAGLTLASDGNFYGVATFGGSDSDGAFFKITPVGAFTILHSFAGGSDGITPEGSPLQAVDGNIYGTTAGLLGTGGATVYKYSPSGTFSTIYQFDSTTEILAPLIQGSDGNLYGTACTGGTNGCGIVFKLTTSGVLLTSYSFPCGTGGSSPASALVQAADRSFYGTTEQGGREGNGTVFKMTGKGNVSILYSFQGGSDGSNPDAGLVQATDGMLYGATSGGGSGGFGTLFQISTAGVYKSLYSFTSTSGEYPETGLIQHTNGTLYGTAYKGGADALGSVYSLNMGLGPFITFVRPMGRAGSTAQILGQGLTGTTTVAFNGVATTSFTVVSDTYMTAAVPSGATTGAVVVTTASGTLTSNKSFQIIAGAASAARAKARQPISRAANAKKTN